MKIIIYLHCGKETNTRDPRNYKHYWTSSWDKTWKKTTASLFFGNLSLFVTWKYFEPSSTSTREDNLLLAGQPKTLQKDSISYNARQRNRCETIYVVLQETNHPLAYTNLLLGTNIENVWLDTDRTSSWLTSVSDYLLCLLSTIRSTGFSAGALMHVSRLLPHNSFLWQFRSLCLWRWSRGFGWSDFWQRTCCVLKLE